MDIQATNLKVLEVPESNGAVVAYFVNTLTLEEENEVLRIGDGNGNYLPDDYVNMAATYLKNIFWQSKGSAGIILEFVDRTMALFCTANVIVLYLKSLGVRAIGKTRSITFGKQNQYVFVELPLEEAERVFSEA